LGVNYEDHQRGGSVDGYGKQLEAESVLLAQNADAGIESEQEDDETYAEHDVLPE
jgi:hypothetical protein